MATGRALRVGNCSLVLSLDGGANVSAPGATVIDAQGRVVMPGLIDTHWHMWHTLFPGMSGDKREDGFFPTVTRFSAHDRTGHVCEHAARRC